MMNKYDIAVIGRCNGMGESDEQGSYVKLVVENARPPNSYRFDFLISEGAAEVLAAELRGAVVSKAGGA